MSALKRFHSTFGTAAAAPQDDPGTSPNPNGYVPVVFTYGGQALSYQEFLNTFYVTLPGGTKVQLGANQYYRYTGGGDGSLLSLGTSYALSSAANAVGALLPTNAPSGGQLKQAFAQWAASQAASPGQGSYANLYLSHFTGGRMYLSNGNLGLGASGEPSPSSPGDSAYGLLYGIVEPYIGAQIGSTTIPGNLADISDIDWFSFPVTLKIWSYDFTNDPGALTCTSVAQGGSGSSIWNALLISGGGTGPTNQYPSTALPTQGSSTVATRLVAPTVSATSGYYSDPAQDLFPYSYLDGYLLYLQQTQGTAQNLVTLSSTFAGIGQDPTLVQYQPQSFTLALDCSGIASAAYSYPSGSVTQITPASQLVLNVSTSLLGAFTITLPWALGTTNYGLPANPQPTAANDALAQGWLSLAGATPSAPSGTYSALTPAASGADGVLQPFSGAAEMQLVYSVNSNPLSGTPDDLYDGGQGTWLTLAGATGLICTAGATYTQYLDSSNSTGPLLIIQTDASGALQTLCINDFGTGPLLTQGAQWLVPESATGLGNNQQLTVTLAQMPLLRNAFLLASATYAQQPLTLAVSPASGSSCTFQVNDADLALSFQPNTDWITLSQPAGIYGANAGYVIAGLTGANASLNGPVTSLQNDVFGWMVADILAALNAGLVAAPITYPASGKSVGNSPEYWFASGGNPFTAGLWGAAAWAGQQWNNAPVANFWDSWAWALFTVPGGTNAYNFPFTDRFASNILSGFNPPPPNPSGVWPVLLEVIVGDSPPLGELA